MNLGKSRKTAQPLEQVVKIEEATSARIAARTCYCLPGQWTSDGGHAAVRTGSED